MQTSSPPRPPKQVALRWLYGCICPRFGQGVDIVTQHWAQLSGMDGMGYAVLHHLAGGPCAKRDPPNPHTKKLALRIVVDVLGARSTLPLAVIPPLRTIPGEMRWPHGVKCVWGGRQTSWARLRGPHLPVGPCWNVVALPHPAEAIGECRDVKDQGRAAHTLSVSPWSSHGGQWGGGRAT